MRNSLTVKELIKQLKKCDPDAIVCNTTDNFEQGHQTVPATHIYEFKGKVVEESFRDAFDGGSYTSEVIRHDEHGETNFIKIS